MTYAFVAHQEFGDDWTYAVVESDGDGTYRRPYLILAESEDLRTDLFAVLGAIGGRRSGNLDPSDPPRLFGVQNWVDIMGIPPETFAGMRELYRPPLRAGDDHAVWKTLRGLTTFMMADSERLVRLGARWDTMRVLNALEALRWSSIPLSFAGERNLVIEISMWGEAGLGSVRRIIRKVVKSRRPQEMYELLQDVRKVCAHEGIPLSGSVLDIIYRSTKMYADEFSETVSLAREAAQVFDLGDGGSAIELVHAAYGRRVSDLVRATSLKSGVCRA